MLRTYLVLLGCQAVGEFIHQLTGVPLSGPILGMVILLCGLTATRAASNVVVADEVRAHRFTLIDPRGGIADDWYTDDPNAPNASRKILPGYSGWGFHSP